VAGDSNILTGKYKSLEIKHKEVSSADIHLRKLIHTVSDRDRQGLRHVAVMVERYELPVYLYRLTILVMTAMVAASVLWATLTKVNIIAEAPGSIIPDGNVKQIQPAVDGVLEKVLVIEGQQVKKGQTLVILASTSYPDTTSLLQQLEHLSDERADHLGSLKSRLKELEAKKAELNTQLKEKRNELTSCKLELEKTQSIADKSERQAKAYKAVYEAGGYSMVDYLQAEKGLAQIEHDLIKEKTDTINIASQIEVLNLQLAQLESQITDEVLEKQAQIKDLAFQIETVRMKLRQTERHFNVNKDSSSSSSIKTAAEYSQDQSEIKAPVAGTVTDIKTLGLGQVVSKGQLLMVIVPANCPLIIEAKLPNKDIGFVRKGQQARLKLAAFPFQDYGVVTGTVTEIEKHPQEDDNQSSYYKVTIKPEQDWIMAAGKKIRFSSGSALTAEIVIRRKSVLSIILEPIQKAADIHWVG